MSDLAYFRLGQMTDGEQGFAQLLLSQLAEEVTLVLVGIYPFQNSPLRLAIQDNLLSGIVQQGSAAAIVASGDHVGTKAARGFEEGVELDLPVAEHVWIRGTAGRIFIEHIVHHTLAVLLGEVYEVEGNSDLARYQFCYEAVLFPFAISMKGGVGVVPVLHEHGKDIVALLLQEQGGYAGVNSSGQSYAYLHD